MKESSGPARPAEIPALRDALAQFVRLVRLVRPFWGLLSKGLVLGLALGLFGMVTPYLTKLLIDEVYPSENAVLMHVLVGGILGVGLAGGILGSIRSYFDFHVSARLATATSLLFFNHLQHLPARFFDQHQVGEIMSRFADVRGSLNSLSTIFGAVFVQGGYLLLVPPLLFLLEWRLALVSLVTLPVTALVMALSARVMRRYHKRAAEAYADLGAYQVEVLSHIRTFKGLGQERRVYLSARERIRTALDQQLRAGAVGQTFGAVTGAANAVGIATLTWFGWTLILEQRMTLGAYIAFMAYVGYLTVPLRSIAATFANFQQTAVNLGRMFEYLDIEPEEDPATAYRRSPRPTRGRGHLELSGVRFGYDPERPVLDGVDMICCPGTVSAVVGASGAGKSSLLRLICGMERPQDGAIRIDGRPIREIPLRELRRQVSVVWQEFGLVQGTVWENLTLGSDETPSREGVDEVVRLCRLDGLLAELPDGYETHIGEWGSALSGGQRQRLALARVLLRDPAILLLDEATSNVDIGTETEILRELVLSKSDRTLLLVTHRLMSVAGADRVFVLEGGRVVGCGTHEGLFASCEAYHRLLQTPTSQEQRHLRVLQPGG